MAHVFSFFFFFFFLLQTFLEKVDEDDFWRAVESMVKALGPVKQVTETLGGENFVSVSIVCSAIMALMEKLNKGSELSKRLADAVKLRFSPWFQPGIASAAALLDPRTTALASYFPSKVVVDGEDMTVDKIIDASWERLRMDALYFSPDLMATRSFQGMPKELFEKMIEAAVTSLRSVGNFFFSDYSLYVT